MTLASYDNYKDSGFQWLGDIPVHWETKRLSSICNFQSGKAHEPFIDDDGNFICVNSRFVSTEGESRKFCTENLSPAQRNDILMVMSDLPNGRALAKAFFVDDDKPYAVNQRVCIISALEANARFLYYQLNRNPLFLRHDDGVNQTHLSNATFTKFPTLAPPLPEQKAIASFLDAETSKIDGLVSEQRRLIELLKEKRQAVISHAVTKGLNPDVAMKPSGVEWLGDVPEHWEVKKLGWILRESPKNGTSPQINADGQIPTFSIAAVKNGTINIHGHLKYADISVGDAQPYLVQKDDILVLRGNGNKALVGTAGIVANVPPENCIYPDILIRIRPLRNVTPWYMVTLLNSNAMRPAVEMAAQTASGVWKISGKSLQELRLTLPPKNEQLEIQLKCEIRTTKLDQLIAKAERAIELLQERRTALISAAVTGKIDVRKFALQEAG